MSRDLGFPATAWGVNVQQGKVPHQLEGGTLAEEGIQMNAHEFLIDNDAFGRILITHDNIVIDPYDGESVEDLAFLVYGLAPRLLRILRRRFSVHASAVVIPGGALALMGHSMAGKSTTTVGLLERGYPLIVDDVLPVDIINGIPMVHGWQRPVHLRASASEYFGYASEPVLGGGPQAKTQLLFEANTDQHRLRYLVQLTLQTQPVVGEGVSLVRLRGRDAFAACVQHTEGAGISTAHGRAEDFFTWVSAIANKVPVYRVSRPADSWSLEAVLDAVEDLIARGGVAGE